MPRTTVQLRQDWQRCECNEAEMETIQFGADWIKVAAGTKAAWQALHAVMERQGYEIRPADTDSYNCRQITGGTGKSLHSYGIALDVNWTTNPYKKTPDRRAVRFSGKATQTLRAIDVKEDKADTDMTKAMVDDIRNIKTVDGIGVFEWGGSWESIKDAMHFELDLTPAQLARGIDPRSIDV